MPRGEKISKPIEIKGEYYLLMMAIDEYSNFSKLQNAILDAKNITEVLTSKYQFKSQNLFMLLNEDATRNKIYNTFFNLRNIIKDADLLLIYFIGHGDYNIQFNEGYWVPQDAKPDELSSLISFSEIKKIVDSFNNKHILIISDSAFANMLINFSN